MMQNLNSNFNKDGVMFTLPSGVKGVTGVISGDTNNGVPTGYLQQSSTVPSEPGLSSGVCMTLNGLRNAAAQKDPHHHQLMPD